MSTIDYYEILGVGRDASGDEIKRAYRQLARTHHPDVADDKSAAESHFKSINEAYEVLSDPAKREQYDHYGRAGAPNGADVGFGGGSFGDIFDMFFGNARAGTRQAGPQRGSDLRYDLQITLEEAFSGTSREIAFQHVGQCDVCRGSGAEPGTLVTPCDRCGGAGIARVVRNTPLGQMVTQTTCPKCRGEGHTIAHPCHACAGSGRRQMDRRLTVQVPAGVDDGSRIRIGANGEAGTNGGPPGDLYVYFNVARHRLFRREGTDTHVDVTIGFAQAALGATVLVPSLDGDVELEIGAGTQTGTRLRVRGHGMPHVRGAQRGDHFVTVRVAVPAKLTRRQRELLEEYAREEGDEVEERSFFDRVKDAFRPE
ncbi:MAG TPA: molecular chaperone DnaJ [Candidatus Tumulicola sp.]|jgi:molecular chaperone DnaJ